MRRRSRLMLNFNLARGFLGAIYIQLGVHVTLLSRLIAGARQGRQSFTRSRTVRISVGLPVVATIFTQVKKEIQCLVLSTN